MSNIESEAVQESDKNKNKRPFWFLDGTLRLLFLDDQPMILDVLCDTFAPIRLFSLHRATSSAQALQMMNAGERYHVCVMDLGVKDVENDEFAVLKRYGHRISFVVLTGSRFPSKGFDSFKLGAKAIIEKDAAFDDLNIVQTVNKQAIMNLISPGHNELDHNTMAESTKVLFENSPETVTEWAQELGISDRQLRKIWKSCFGVNAKYSLFIYHLYQQAFNFYDKVMNQPEEDESKVSVENPETYKKIEEYFLLNRGVLLSLIS